MQRVDGGIVYQSQYQQSGQNVQGAGVSETGAIRQELLQMAKGTVFEGVITEVKDKSVQLSLTNGQSIRAQLEQGVNVRIGEPVLFEVKSNQDGQIMLRQVPVQSALNPTLQKALTAAGLPLTQKNLSMVDIMMRNQMPIGRESLSAMVKQMLRFPQASAETLVQMQKLGFSVNKESIAQFEAYKSGEHALVDKFSQMIEQLSELPGETGGDAGKMIEVQNQILDILEVNAQTAHGENAEQILQETGERSLPELNQTAEGSIQGTEGVVQEAEGVVQEAKGIMQEAEGVVQGTKGDMQAVEGAVQEAKGIMQEAEGVAQGTKGDMQTAEGAVQSAKGSVPAAEDGLPVASGTVPVRQTVADLFSEDGINALSRQLEQLPGMTEDGRLFTDGKLNTNISAKEMLSFIQQNLQQGEKPETSLLKGLFGQKEYKSLLKQVTEEQWLLEPRQVESKENVEKLYERINRQMGKLEQFLQETGRETMGLNRQTTQVRSNLEMMNQINQLYNYIQIPLKLQNQNAHSDLYVYTNKKKLLDKDGELSALLHLELENLGTTDVQIKMFQNHVTTNFYLSDESSFRLVEEHIDSLQERLEEKGYQCKIQLEKRIQETDFVQDFLERETPVGQLQRYSFDVLT